MSHTINHVVSHIVTRYRKSATSFSIWISKLKYMLQKISKQDLMWKVWNEGQFQFFNIKSNKILMSDFSFILFDMLDEISHTWCTVYQITVWFITWHTEWCLYHGSPKELSCAKIIYQGSCFLANGKCPHLKNCPVYPRLLL